MPNAQPFDQWKANQTLPVVPSGYRRIWQHLFPSQAALAAWVEADRGRGEDFDDPWEPGAYTDDYDDVYCGEYPAWRNALGIGTDKVTHHELRHIWLNGPDEDGVKNGDDEHHHLGRCSALGLCIGANHGLRLIDTHTGGVPKALANRLLAAARAAPKDSTGVRHGFIDVPEADILKVQA